jgi:hypothetical protein
MKRYVQWNDPLFDAVALGYVLHRGGIRDRNKRLRWQGIKSLVLRIRTGKSHFVRSKRAPIFPPYLKLTVALVEKVWEILKGLGRDSIARLRNLYFALGPRRTL